MPDFFELICAQAQRYPRLTPQDVCKAMLQAAMGPGHIITDADGAERRLREELNSVQPEPSVELIETLGGRFCRIHLGAVKASGLSIKTLFQLFFNSSRIVTGDRDELEVGISAMISLADAGALPFSGDEAREYAEGWRAAGYPVLSHSDRFHEYYSPAYRVISDSAYHLLPLFCRIDKRLRAGERTILAIDGMSGSGKSTLAALLQSLYDCTVFRADDYFLRTEQRTPERYREPGGNLDRERLLEEILLPLHSGAEEITCRAFDCGTMTLGEPKRVHAGKVVIVEGSYSMHPELARYYTDTVYITIDEAHQRERINERNGDTAQRFFDEWIPLENAYRDATQVNRRCEFLFDARDLSVNMRQE